MLEKRRKVRNINDDILHGTLNNVEHIINCAVYWISWYPEDNTMTALRIKA
jgi:hypothetical protein